MRWSWLVLLSLVLTSVPAPAQARSETECMTAWARAVRSYLTQNRKANPDGTLPEDLDGEEAAAQAWMRAFSPACTIEQSGETEQARVEAALIGTRILARLDPRGCTTFLGSFMESTRPSDICSAATQDGIDIRTQIARTIPPR